MASACELSKNAAENATVHSPTVTKGAISSGSKASTLTSRAPRKSKRDTATAGTAPTAKATAAACSAMLALRSAWCGKPFCAKCSNQPPWPRMGRAVASK